ncbi:MAG TPA: DUF2164 domain-containing protein [Brevundimonas sp.]|jgi:uncharacterized protein (DUF2164 family)
MKPADPIEFSKDEMRDMIRRVQAYFDAELEQDIGALPAEMLIAFFGREVGGFFYNRGVRDAQQLIQQKTEDIVEALYGLERSR